MPSSLVSRRRVLVATLLVVGATLGFAPIAGATTYTWTNATGGNWTAPANWSPAGVPGAGDAAVLPVLGAGYAVTVDACPTIASLAVGAGVTVRLGTDDSLTYTGRTLVNDGLLLVGPGVKNSIYLRDSTYFTGAGTLQMTGKGRVYSPYPRPQTKVMLINDVSHTIAGDGDLWVPIVNRGTLRQDGTGSRLLTLWEKLYNYGTVLVSNDGWINVNTPFVASHGGRVIGHNGSFTCMMPYGTGANYGPIDNLDGGTFIADHGTLSVSAGVVAGGEIAQWGDTCLVAFHDVGNPNNLVVDAGANLLLDGGTNYHLDTVALQNHGTIHVQGTLWLGTAVGDTACTSADGTIVLEGGTLMGGQNMSGGSQWVLNAGTITGCGTIAGDFINVGTMSIDCPSGYDNITSPHFLNRGTVRMARGYLKVTGSGVMVQNTGTFGGGDGGMFIEQGATVRNSGGTLVAGRGGVRFATKSTATVMGGTLAGDGGVFYNAGATTLSDVTIAPSATYYTLDRAATTASGAAVTVQGTNDLEGSGTFTAGAATSYVANGATVLHGGTLTVARGITNAGTLAGWGTVAAQVVNAGEVAPSITASGLNVAGDFAQGATGRLTLGVAGYTADAMSHFNVSGAAALGGTAHVTAANGFVPANGKTFPVLACAARTGEFAVVDGDMGVALTPLYDAASVQIQTPFPAGVDGADLPRVLRFAPRGAGFALELPAAATVDVRAYDVAGRLVAVLATGARPAGVHALALPGGALARGVYFARASVVTGGRARVLDARLVHLR